MATQKQAYSFDVVLSHRHGMHTHPISRLDSFDLASDARKNKFENSQLPSDTHEVLTDYACQWVYLNPGLTFFQIQSLACWILRTACRLVETEVDVRDAPIPQDGTRHMELQRSLVAPQHPRGLTAMIRFYTVLSPASAQTERFPDCETAWEMLTGLHAHLSQAQNFFHQRAILQERPAELVKRCFVLPVLEFSLVDWERSLGRRNTSIVAESLKEDVQQQQMQPEIQSSRSLVEDLKRAIRRETVERVRSGPSLQKHGTAGGKPPAQHQNDAVQDGTDFWTLPRPQSQLGPIRKPTSPADVVYERRRVDVAGPIVSAFERAESIVKFKISVSPPTPPPSPSFRPIVPTSPPPTPPSSPATDTTAPARQDSLQSAEGQVDRSSDLADARPGEIAMSKDHLRSEASGHEKVTREEESASDLQPPRLSLPGYCLCCGIIASSSRH
ncbi:hypothetical protein KC318_g5413 [Hortaea werneckii]|nr:hypothetical protein KC334_g5830 [Hortaea werneckii]KAI7011105.1 hypothetical protein KC355_g5889 [Hortaea werneckii]KAI7181659.1 hypothetical protein KC324_g8555 [Hortaea werneckii]KAI7580969.1 hypothetical protein KC316_g8699 [Hortaea werneckii]KAI7668211.1 hypothetical protein KC318_g5413 [Hortaea werneckii]